MTTRQLMATCAQYYGEPYTGVVEMIVTEYLDQFSDELRASLFREVVKKHQRSFRTSPDVAAFEAVLEAARAGLRANRPSLPPPLEIPSDEERAEFWRRAEEAKKTPAGRFIFGLIGRGA